MRTCAASCPESSSAAPFTQISAVSYLNARPLVYGLQRWVPHRLGLQLSFDLPSRCAQKLADGQAHIGLLPVIAYARIPDLVIADGIGIGTRTYVHTVLLVGEVPLEDIEEVLLDYSSSTSVSLLKILCRRKWGIQPRFIETRPGYEAHIGGRTAGLVIGDRAFAHLQRWPYVYDLAREWVEWTGTGFVFAFWAGYPEHLTPERASLLRRSLEVGLSHRAHIARQWQQVHGGDAGFYLDYLQNRIEYYLAPVHLLGMQLFFELAYAESLIPAVPQLRWIPSDLSREQIDAHHPPYAGQSPASGTLEPGGGPPAL